MTAANSALGVNNNQAKLQADSAQLRKRPLTSLRARLSLILILSLIPAALYLLIDVLAIRQQVRADAEAELLRTAQLVANTYSQQVAETHRMLEMIAQFPEIQSGDAAACSQRLAQLTELYQPRYRGLGVVDLQGNMFCTSAPITGTVNVADRIWFKEALRTGQAAIGEFAVSRPVGDATLGLSYPVRDASGKIVRVVANGMVLSILQAQANQLPLPQDAALTITDRNGVILVRVPGADKWVGKPQSPGLLKHMYALGTGIVETIGVDGIMRMYAFTPVLGPGEADVWLSVGRTLDVVYAGVWQRVVRDLLGVGAILLTAMVGIWFASNRLLLRRIDELAEASGQLAAGDWQARVPPPSARGRSDELDRLALAFNHMAGSVQQARDEAEQAAMQVNQLQQFTATLGRTLTYQQVSEVLLSELCAITGAAAATLAVLNEEGSEFRLMAQNALDPEKVQPWVRFSAKDATPMGDAVRTGELVLLPSRAETVARYPALMARAKPQHQAWVAIPCMLDGRGVGAVGLNFDHDLTPGELEGELLLALGQQCAQALERARLYEAEQDARLQLEERVAERTAELERSNRELNQFAYVASHDLKAPLRAIDQLATWISEDVGERLPAESAAHPAKLRGRVRRMEKLLDDLLAYSRAGRIRPAVESVNVNLLVHDIVALLAPPAGFVVRTGTLPVLCTPRVSLELVLRNLIGNALKHHQGDVGQIEITAVEQDEWVEFAVHDDGPGIAPQYHERIFEMFQTLRPRDEVEGSGMGLALVKKLVESYGGTITVESAAGHGATFRFTWPREVK